jgi:hypothetical protein
MHKLNNIILLSEKVAPPQFEEIWRKENVLYSIGGSQKLKDTEKLFIYKGESNE